jgi:HK97 family phage major capsid protein/HK97 family phage prohead protease
MHRAYALLTIEKSDEASRTISGIASTPAPDRDGDVMDSTGAAFTLPLPLLWHHDRTRPIGEVVSAEVTSKGIAIVAKIAHVTEAGALRDRLDEAWQTIKAGLIKGLSIGFRPLSDPEPIAGGGYHFRKWSWLELSAVTVPANAAATINLVKSLDDTARAATGDAVVSIQSTPGVAGTVVVKTTQVPAMKIPIADQIATANATRGTKAARMAEIMSAAGDNTLNADQSKEYDALVGEVKALDDHVARLTTLDTINKATAAPVDPQRGTPAPSPAPAPTGTHTVVGVQRETEKGIEFARAVICKAASFAAAQRGEFVSAAEIAKSWYPDSSRLALHLKAVVPPGNTTNATWASPLVDPANLASEFIEYLRPRTIVGRIPALRRVPFNVRIIGQTSGGAGYWVGQGKPKPLTSFDFAPTILGWAKVAAIAAITEELARFSTPGAEGLVRDALTAALVERIDIDFIDPAKAAVAGVSPASITNGVAPITSEGNDAAAIRADIGALLGAYLAANQNVAGLTLIMPATLALQVSLLRNAQGVREFPSIGIDGGTLEGITVVTSQYAKVAAPHNNIVIAANAPDIFLADDGSVTVDVSREASLEMSDAPTQDGGAGTGAELVSLWQNNLIGLRAERFINWAKRRPEAVVWLSDVAWGTPEPEAAALAARRAAAPPRPSTPPPSSPPLR